jgi:hypothetical protein
MARVRNLRRLFASIVAGDRRIWLTAAIAAVPLIAVIVLYCVHPRNYYTGSNNVEVYTYVAQTPAGERVCVPGLDVPSDTRRIRLQLLSQTTTRPTLHMVLTPAGAGPSVHSTLEPTTVPPNRISTALFPVSRLPASVADKPATMCLSAAGLVNWGGTPFLAPARVDAPTIGGRPIAARVAVWYLPDAGARRSYLSRASEILSRASLFRAGAVGPWLYVVILLLVLPGLALASVRTLALAVGRSGSSSGVRRLATCVFAIAAINFMCWSLITPPFQAPDEVDHFAYTQSLVERGEAPSRDPASPRGRWSSAEGVALEDMSFLTDRQVGDTFVPWSQWQDTAYRLDTHRLHPSAGDGGGNETAALHGAVYYAALAPAYALASDSPLAQLTLMRFASAVIGALVVLFAFLIVRELAPGRQWLAVLAALLIAYEPMYGFISGSVNNDVGVNAAAAALELLLILILRRGVTVRLGLLAGSLLVVLPIIKGTAYSLYPVAALVLLVTLVRHHRRIDLPGWAALVLSGVAILIASRALGGIFHSVAATGAGTPAEAGTVKGAVSEAIAHPGGYLSYVWQVFLPRLSFMAAHFEPGVWPAFVIFVERGWGAFGWYDVFFPVWVYVVIVVVMLSVPLLALLAALREWAYVRRNALTAAALILMPLAVVAGFEGAFFTMGKRPAIAEFGRYAFPAIAPLAVLVVGCLHAFGRRWVLFAGVSLLVAMLGLSYASQLLTLTAFYA